MPNFDRHSVGRPVNASSEGAQLASNIADYLIRSPQFMTELLARYKLFFRGTVVTVGTGTTTENSVQIIRAGQAAPDANYYPIYAAKYVPKVGDDVLLCQFDSHLTAAVIGGFQGLTPNERHSLKAGLNMISTRSDGITVDAITDDPDHIFYDVYENLIHVFKYDGVSSHIGDTYQANANVNKTANNTITASTGVPSGVYQKVTVYSADTTSTNTPMATQLWHQVDDTQVASEVLVASHSLQGHELYFGDTTDFQFNPARTIDSIAYTGDMVFPSGHSIRTLSTTLDGELEMKVFAPNGDTIATFPASGGGGGSFSVAPWDSSTSYVAGDVVIDIETYFIATQDSVDKEPAAYTNYWYPFYGYRPTLHASDIGITIVPAPTGLTTSAGSSGIGSHLTASTTYYYAICGLSDLGNIATATSVVGYIEGGSPTKINLSWTPPANGAYQFNVYKGTSAVLDNLRLLATVSGDTTTYTDDGSIATGSDAPPTVNQTGSINAEGLIVSQEGIQSPYYQAEGITGAVSSSRYAGATGSFAPSSGNFLEGDWIVTNRGALYTCVSAGSPGTWVASALSPIVWSNAASYVPQDCVSFAETYYVATTANSGQSPSENPSYWYPLYGYRPTIDASDIASVFIPPPTSIECTDSGFAAGSFITSAVYYSMSAVSAIGNEGMVSSPLAYYPNMHGNYPILSWTESSFGAYQYALYRGVESDGSDQKFLAYVPINAPYSDLGTTDTDGTHLPVIVDQTGSVRAEGLVAAGIGFQGPYFHAHGLTGVSEIGRFVGATDSGAPTSGTFDTGDFIVTYDGHIYICTAGGTPGIWAGVSSSGSGPAVTIYAINAGGDSVGPPSYVADTDFSSGGSASTFTGTVDTSLVSNPAPQDVYLTERWDSSGTGFTYTIADLTPSSEYIVRLHFAEDNFTATGQRAFNVALQGTSILTNYDIIAEAGSDFKAIAPSFTTTSDSSGNIAIVFTDGTHDHAKINGIEIIVPEVGTLEITDGTHDLEGVTKLTITGAVVGGTPSAATLAIDGLELTDGTTDLSDVTKITVSGATVGGTSTAATLTIVGGGGGGGPVPMTGAEYQTLILADSPLAYWPLGDSGSSIADATGNGHTGTVSGTVSEGVEGPFSGVNAIAFDGSGSIAVSDLTGFPTTSDYTLEAWIYTLVTGSNGIVGYGDFSTTGGSLALRTDGGTNIMNYWWSEDLTVTAPPGYLFSWHHVAATWNHTSNYRKIYFDGICIGADQPTPAPSFDLSNFNIGVTNFGEWFDGTIGQVVIYGTELSSDKIWGRWLARIEGGAGTTTGTLELTDGTHDLDAVTKITVSGATVGGSSDAATLTFTSSPSLEITDGTTDLTDVSKITFSGATVGGTSDAATVTVTGGTGTIIPFSWSVKTSNYTITTSDTGIEIDASEGDVLITLPTAVGADQLYVIKRIDTNYSNTAAVNTTSSQTIDGYDILNYVIKGQSYAVGSDNSNWGIAAAYYPNPMTTLGDIVVGGTDGQPERLGVGSNTQVLTANSAATDGLDYEAP